MHENADNLSEFDVAIETTATPELPRSDREQLEDLFLEHNVFPTQSLIEQLDRLIDEKAIERGGEVIRATLRKITGTPAGRALERVVLGDGGKSLEDDAKEVGCTRQNLHKQVKAIRRRLTAGPLVDGSNLSRGFEAAADASRA
jgi:hypothetical protein